MSVEKRLAPHSAQTNAAVIASGQSTRSECDRIQTDGQRTSVQHVFRFCQPCLFLLQMHACFIDSAAPGANNTLHTSSSLPTKAPRLAVVARSRLTSHRLPLSRDEYHKEHEEEDEDGEHLEDEHAVATDAVEVAQQLLVAALHVE